MNINKNDLIREDLLKALYGRFKSAHVRPRAGVYSVRVLGRDENLKKYTDEEIYQNFEFLIQTGWIKKERINKAEFFIISDKGINHFEGSSEFQKSHWQTGINITSIKGITVVGDNNFVRQEYTELYGNLDILLEEIRKSAAISDEEKLNYQSDIETIKSQLIKQKPDSSILKKSWLALNSLSAIEGIIKFYERIKPLIEGLLK